MRTTRRNGRLSNPIGIEQLTGKRMICIISVAILLFSSISIFSISDNSSNKLNTQPNTYAKIDGSTSTINRTDNDLMQVHASKSLTQKSTMNITSSSEKSDKTNGKTTNGLKDNNHSLNEIEDVNSNIIPGGASKPIINSTLQTDEITHISEARGCLPNSTANASLSLDYSAVIKNKDDVAITPLAGVGTIRVQGRIIYENVYAYNRWLSYDNLDSRESEHNPYSNSKYWTYDTNNKFSTISLYVEKIQIRYGVDSLKIYENQLKTNLLWQATQDISNTWISFTSPSGVFYISIQCWNRRAG